MTNEAKTARALMDSRTREQMVGLLREAARREREHIAITFEYGKDIINAVAAHGDELADAVNSHADLLAALRAAVKTIASMGGDLEVAAPESINANTYRDDLARLNAAIRKAEG